MGRQIVFKCSVCGTEEAAPDTIDNALPKSMAVFKMNLDILNNDNSKSYSLPVLKGLASLGLHMSNVFFICHSCYEKMDIKYMASEERPVGKAHKDLNEKLAMHNCKYYPPSFRRSCDLCQTQEESDSVYGSGFLTTEISFSFDSAASDHATYFVTLCPGCQKDFALQPGDIAHKAGSGHIPELLKRASKALFEKLRNQKE
jgi:hypothetical protein